MILARLTRAIRQQNWFAVAIEFVIVIAGVVIGFQITAWNTAQTSNALARESLVELREDFRANLLEIDDKKTNHEAIIEAMIFLLEESARDVPDASVEALNDALRHIHHMPAFIPITRTFDNLVGSGDLNLIASRELQDALARFNRQYGTTRLVQSTHELELVHTFQPYIIENLDYSQIVYDRTSGEYPLPSTYGNGNILAVVNEREFRNVLIQKWTITSDLLSQMRLLRAEAQSIIDLLDAELGGAEP